MRLAGRRGLIPLAVVALAAGACGPRNNHTLLVANVDTDMTPGQIDEIQIDVRSAGESTTETFPVGKAQLGIRPKGKSEFEIEVTAKGMLKNNVVVSQTAAGLRFVSGKSLQFTLFLGRGCAGKSCTEDRTCVGAGDCKPRSEIVMLAPYPGEAPGMGGMGGGARDGGGADRSAMGGGGGGGAGGAGGGDARPRDGRPYMGTWSVATSADVPAQANLAAVWPIAPNDVWAVGSVSLRAVAYHFNGTAWMASSLPASTMTTPLTGVWAASANDVWATGYGGTVLRWMGGAWTPVPSGTTSTLTSIWGSAANDIWVVGNAGTLLHWTGSSFTSDASIMNVNLLAVTGASMSALFAVGTGGAIYRGSAATGWARQNHGLTMASLFGVWAASASDVWAVGTNVALHFDGGGWTLHRGAPDNANGVWGSAGDDVWAVGSVEMMNGPIARWDGVQWSNVPAPSVPGVAKLSLQAVRGLSATDVWAVGTNGTILRFQGR